MQILRFIILLISLSVAWAANAVIEAEPLATDTRLRVIVYNPNEVFKINGFYGYQSSMVFAPGEEVETLTMGDTVSWQIQPSGNRIFFKPIDKDVTTNMTVITNKRVYYFELHDKSVDKIDDPDMVFSIKFLYPEDDNQISSYSGTAGFYSADEPDISDKDRYNFDYTISGPESITPVKIFDDGIFTYFEFKDRNNELPAIFTVAPDKTESLVNFRISGRYLVVEKVAPRFTLRNGVEVGCVFNEAYLAKQKVK